jgi:class 3 adenylate cyclase
LSRYGGREVTHTGDGILAAFRSLSQAIACAAAIQRALREYNGTHDPALRVRIGLHAGRPLPEEDRLFGSCVNVTVRVCAAAQAGRVLCSELVRELASSSSFRFRDSGLFELKGIEQPLRLYELVWGELGPNAPDPVRRGAVSGRSRRTRT